MFFPITLPGFKTLPHPTSTLSPIIAPNFFKPVSIASSLFFTITSFLSDFTFEVIEREVSKKQLEKELGYKINIKED